MPARQDVSLVSEHANPITAPPVEDPAYHATPDTSLQSQKLGFIPPQELDRQERQTGRPPTGQSSSWITAAPARLVPQITLEAIAGQIRIMTMSFIRVDMSYALPQMCPKIFASGGDQEHSDERVRNERPWIPACLK